MIASGSRYTSAIVTLLWLLAPVTSLVAQETPAQETPAGQTVVEPGVRTDMTGTIRDAVGRPVPGCRVITRLSNGTDVYVSPPSDDEGGYAVSVPAGRSYIIVALVSPTGGRMAWPDETATTVGEEDAVRDLNIPMVMAVTPRNVAKGVGGFDRLFLSFVEDPALVRRQYYEGRLRYSEFDLADVLTLDVILAFQPRALSQVEVGLRGAFADVDPAFGSGETGLEDTDAWAKFSFYRSSSNRLELGTGAIVTFPTGDSDKGLGRDSLQSKLYLAGSYGGAAAAMIWHVGVRVTGDGELFGARLEGAVSGTAALGFIFPFSSKIGLVLEANYEGERFEDFGETSRLLAGVDWRTVGRGRFRGAVTLGLVDDSPNAEILLGYAYSF